jgi:hypothetical protein
LWRGRGGWRSVRTSEQWSLSGPLAVSRLRRERGCHVVASEQKRLQRGRGGEASPRRSSGAFVSRVWSEGGGAPARRGTPPVSHLRQGWEAGRLGEWESGRVDGHRAWVGTHLGRGWMAPRNGVSGKRENGYPSVSRLVRGRGERAASTRSRLRQRRTGVEGVNTSESSSSASVRSSQMGNTP